MAKKQFNSPSDRRWQRRYQLIQERKEANYEFDREKKERKKEKKREKGFFWKVGGFKLNRLMSEKIAVACINEKEVSEVLSVFQKEHPEWGYNIPPNDVLYFYGPEVVFGLCRSEFYPHEEYMRIDSRRYFEGRGYEIADFYECCEMKDLGDINGYGTIDDLFTL